MSRADGYVVDVGLDVVTVERAACDLMNELIDLADRGLVIIDEWADPASCRVTPTRAIPDTTDEGGNA